MRQLRNLLYTKPSDRILLFVTLILLTAIKFGLWILPFRYLFKLVTIITEGLNSKAANQVTLSQIIWAVNVITRYMPGGAKCLARALTTQVLMNWCGFKPEFRIGVAKSETGLDAHAWIEYQGRIAIGNLSDLSRFIPLPSLTELNDERH
jgi:hypothetical protein